MTRKTTRKIVERRIYIFYKWHYTRPTTPAIGLGVITERLTMSIALLVETTDTNGAKEQTIVAPVNNEVRYFHRVSTGSRGRGQAWKQVELDDLPLTSTTHSPTAVALTLKDSEALSYGQITTLGVKLLVTTEQADQIEQGEQHRVVVSSLTDRLTAGDNTLNDYLKDGRRTTPIRLVPLQVKPEINIPAQEVSLSATPAQVGSRQPVSVFTNMELASVPAIKWSQTYINRKIAGRLDFDIYDNAMRNHENILIMGHAGSGKTMSVLAYASARGHRYYNVSSHIGLEPTQLFGSWIPTPDGHFRWQDGAVTDLVRNGGVLLLNEVNFMPERVTTILFGLLDDRREIQIMENGGEVIRAHPELLIVADMNPHYRGTRPMNQAWVDRFHHKLNFPYDPSIENKLVKNKALLEMADKLRDLMIKGKLNTPISTRSLVNFIKNTENLGLDYATECYANTFIDDTEREAVTLVLDTYKHNIGKELGIEVAVAPKQVDEVSL